MARARDVNRKIRRRRIVAVVVFLLVVAAAAGVSVAAIKHHEQPKAQPPPPPPPPPKPFRVIFPEGFTRLQMAARVKAVAKIANGEHRGRVRLAQAPYLAASRKAVVPCFGKRPQTNLEGFLFPDTYDFLVHTPARALVHAQIQSFCDHWRTVNLAYARSKNLTPYDVLKIASMVEKEAAVDRDRPLIAAVIYNRLHNRMPLGIDATLRYGLHIPPTKSITTAEKNSSSPYNTGLAYGMPPTPIANPGLPSIEAAAHPARVDYLYYVRIPGTRRHKFFSSYGDFQNYLATHGYGPHS
jgi:uncharacterized YceG family protein